MTTPWARRKVLLSASLAALAAAWALVLPSCSSDKKEPDCVPAAGAKTDGDGKTYEMTPLLVDKEAKKNNDWCRACIMGPKGYASCQRVYGDTPTEPRDVIRQRARTKACVDSGFPADGCPDKATIGITCKGDPPPPNAGDPAKALQDLYKKLNPPNAKPESGGVKPPSDEAAPVIE